MKFKKIVLILIVIIGAPIVKYYMSIDYSGEWTLDGIEFKGEEYTITEFAFTEEGKKIGEADSWDIREIPEDKEHNFLAVRSFLDNYYVAKNSYNIPKEGKINVVYIGSYRYTDEALKNAIKYLLNEEIIENFYIRAEIIYGREIYVGYEDCPVGTEYVGNVGYVNDKLVYIKPTEIKYKDNGAREEQVYCCYIIPSQYKKAFGIHPYYTNRNANVVEQ